MPALRLLCWNTHLLPVLRRRNRVRRARLLSAIVGRKVDVVCLQEVWHHEDADFLATALAEEGFDRIDGGGNHSWTLGGVVTFCRRARWAKAAPAQFHEFRARASRVHVLEGDGWGRKGVLRLELSAATGERVTIYNTHLQAQYGRRQYREIRIAQAEELVRFCGDAETPALLAGDFNTTPADAPVYSIVRARFRDLTEDTRARYRRGTYWAGRGACREWLDYVWARGFDRAAVALSLIENRGPDDPFSDHDGLVAELL
jgi:endonuclease/exonuclease/phosphatase family metal-dependent hydrolase